MDKFTNNLRQRFQGASFFFLSAWEYDPNGKKDGGTARDCTELELRMIDIFDRLSETVETIPPAISRDAEELRARLPKSFEEILEALIDHVGGKYESGGHFEPANAGDFLQQVNEFVRLRQTSPSLFARLAALTPLREGEQSASE